MGDYQHVEPLSTHAIQHLASHWHRYYLWCNKAHIPNVHGTLERFYEGVVKSDDLDKVREYHEVHHKKESKG